MTNGLSGFIEIELENGLFGGSASGMADAPAAPVGGSIMGTGDRLGGRLGGDWNRPPGVAGFAHETWAIRYVT